MNPKFWLGLSLVVCACSGAPARQAPYEPASASTPWQFDSAPVQAQTRPQNTWQSYPTRTLAAELAQAVAPDRVGPYGGAADLPTHAASGFFRIEKLGNRWWLIDPAGQRFIHAGVAAVNHGQTPNNKTALAQKFGDEESWAREVAQWLRDAGFNGVGAWSNTRFLAQAAFRTPHARIVNFMGDYGKERGGTYQKPGHTGYPNDAIFVFDPGFASFAQRYADKLSEEAANPWLIGWFSDNELPLYDKSLERFLALPASDPGAIEAQRWLAQRQGLARANQAAITAEDRQAFVGHVYETYLRIVSTALRKADPHHLYLGSRLHSDELKNRAVFEAAGKYLDAISLNFYRGWAPEFSQLREWEAWSGRPVIITEWYTKGMDSGLANTTGAGWIVNTQADRGRHYQNFVLNLLESRVVIGWHWFKYMDNDPSDLSTDPSNRDANKGLVDIRYTPYTPLLDAARIINLRKYAFIAQQEGLQPPHQAPARPPVYNEPFYRDRCYYQTRDPFCDPYYDPYWRRDDRHYDNRRNRDQDRDRGIPLPPMPPMPPLPGRKGFPKPF